VTRPLGYESTVSDVDATSATGPAAPGVRGGQLAPGTRIGRYEVVRLLGRGGMGAVYAAHDPQLDRQVALKLLHRSSHLAPESLVQEAKALAKLDDPHVVQVFDAGEHDGEVFVAMQLVQGEDLAAALRREPSRGQTIAWFVAAGRGLVAAHAAGLIHRDFKPSNVLLDARGRVAVTDFGLAVSARGRDRGEDDYAGTPAYMAPELHEHASATEASDQFAFCVALWEALFQQHPYVSRGRRITSMLEIAQEICGGPLIAPARRGRASRRLVEILSRGLARDPARRWPSMTELLAQLAPIQRTRVWPMLAIGAAAAIVGAGAVWLHAAAPASKCDAGQRLTAVWSPKRADGLRAHFVASGRSNANQIADETVVTIDRYATHWEELATETCTNERAAGGSTDLLQRRRSCLDSGLARLLDAVDVLDDASVDVVDDAHDVVERLPRLASCADPTVLQNGPGLPPSEITGKVHQLNGDLGRLTARQSAGALDTLELARSLADRADALKWEPSMARAHLALGIALARAYQPALDELERGLDLAFANHLDRDALMASGVAGEAAAELNKPDVVEMIIARARTMSARVADPKLALAVDIADGRAHMYLHHVEEGLETCKTAIAKAKQLHDEDEEGKARQCVFEGLVTTGRLDELRQVAAECIASITKRFGSDSPSLISYRERLADVDVVHGDVPAARAEIDRAVNIVARAFPSGKTPRNVEVLATLGEVELAEGKTAQGTKTLRDALAIAQSIKPVPPRFLVRIGGSLSELLWRADDLAGAEHVLEDAIAIVRAENAESTELASLLLDYGQLEQATDYEKGLGALNEAEQILEHHHDPRAMYATAAMSSVEAENDQWADARKHAEQALAYAQHDPAAIPGNTAQLEFVLARALVETHGDRERARNLAVDARVTLVKLGPTTKRLVNEIDAWRASKHL
jgi:eukaryotic-like serine/threonine-protein kinase